jgi:hypothetical protein
MIIRGEIDLILKGYQGIFNQLAHPAFIYLEVILSPASMLPYPKKGKITINDKKFLKTHV